MGSVQLGVGFQRTEYQERKVDLSEVAKTSVEIPATSPNSAAQGKFISTTSVLTKTQKFIDLGIGTENLLNGGKSG